MEKFTHMSDGYFAVDAAVCFEDQNEEYSGPAIERLAAYEASGLTPEEVFLYAKAREEGRIQELPCRIGATVYELRKIFRTGRGKRHDTSMTGAPGIERIMTDNRYEIYVAPKRCTKSDFNWLGKTVFLSEEEAKATLEERKNA